MRIANLMHGALSCWGAYVGVSILKVVPKLWLAVLLGALVIGALGGLIERFVLRALAGNSLGQVLVTLGLAFIIADLCLVVWGGDPIPVRTPEALRQPVVLWGVAFPIYRLVVVGVAIATAAALYLLRAPRLCAMIRAGWTTAMHARRHSGSRIFTLVFCMGARLPAPAARRRAMLSAYPVLYADMLRSRSSGSLGGVGQSVGRSSRLIVGFVYTFGTARLPDLAM